MHYLVISVLCSVAVSVLLKLAKRYRIDVRQAIMVNYLVAAVATLLWFDPRPQALLQPEAVGAWPILIALGILLPSIFVVWALAVRHGGVVRADASQRLSLLLPLVAAFTLFGQPFNWLEGLGAALGLLAIAGLVARRNAGRQDWRGGAWLWLLLLFVGMGAIDILFKEVARLTGVPFPAVLLAAFVLAFVLSVLAIGGLAVAGRARLHWRYLLGGVLLGVLNFGNIVSYVEAHRALPENPALVFSAMNIGVIVVATLVGVGLFHERLNHWNRAGLVLAVVAVIVLATA
ncbi:MAG: EamA family transporter [Gammaproteobacteria bacterium]|nr:EamA family transporter [Gammaproteobacteria bacterium]